LDSSVLLPLLDREARIVPRDQVTALNRFRYRILRRNIKVKISIIVLGEVLQKAVKEDALEILNELSRLLSYMNERLEFCSLRKFRNAYSRFPEVLQSLLNEDDWLRDSPTDALILTQALLDAEVNVLYTSDTKLLLSTRIKDFANRIREREGYNPMRIKAP